MTDSNFALDLVLTLRRHAVPFEALDLSFFSERERVQITAYYEYSLGELEASIRKPKEQS